MTETELIGHCREHIAGYKLPRSFTFREGPAPVRRGQGAETELRKPFWEGMERRVN